MADISMCGPESSRNRDSSPDFLNFWGKHAEGFDAHSVAHHCLDVAAAAAALLPIFPPPVKVPSASIIALIALHDIGKFSRTFQAQVPALWPASLGPFTPPIVSHRHDQAGFEMLSGPLSSLLDPLFTGWINAARLPLLRAIAGHHGRPPEVPPGGGKLPSSVVCAACLAAATAFIEAIFTLLAPPALPKLDPRQRQALAWWFAGFTVVADWIGSAQQWFPPVDAASNPDLAVYWHARVRTAQDAVREAGLIPAGIATETGMAALFPGRDPRPLQLWAEAVTLPEGPCLFVIEDVTGAGKTEAALVLTHLLMRAARARGAFVALPTMATANAMYERLSQAYARLFVAGSVRPSLVLAHGRSKLNDAFTDSILDGATADGGDVRNDDPDALVAAQCAAWIADNRRKAFLAQIGVGTIDQALLAVLPARHSPLRLLGLSQRVLIVDEAHAYDPYVNAELQRLLEFHAAMGGSAIVLSATLTAKQRTGLCRAFRTGLGCDDDPDEPVVTVAYPAATVVSAAGSETHALLLAKDLRRKVAVERVASAEAAAGAIIAAASADAAVAWIRNTVDDAIEATELLRARGVDPLLFHARFAMGDRLKVEQEVLRLFGPNSTADERAGRVLVATQVVEQSLDVDFDLLVTDLAPADLVVQRAGRLWRHPKRNDARPIAGPRLLLLSPEPVADPPANWLGDAASQYVYRNPAVLWRSARALLSAGMIITASDDADPPGNIRDLVEAAYDEANTPAGIEKATALAKGQEAKSRGAAGQNVLDFEPPYENRSGSWDPDHHTPTRDGEPQTTLRLATFANGRLMPWCDDRRDYRAWCLSEISVRAARVAGVVEVPASASALTTLRAQWSRWDREMPVLVLRSSTRERSERVLRTVDDTIWHGHIIDRHGEQRRVTYTRATGLIWN